MSNFEKYDNLVDALEELLLENNQAIKVLSNWVDKLQTKLSDTEKELEELKRRKQEKEKNEND